MPYKTEVRGWMLESDLKILESWAQALPPRSTIVEVGSMYGRSAYCFAASAPESTVWCIDPWMGEAEPEVPESEMPMRLELGFPLSGMRNTLEHFQSNLAALPNVKPVRGFSPEEFGWWDQPIDLFFLDAQHTNPGDWRNLEFWRPFVRKGGYIGGHDYHADGSEFPDVRDNVHRLRDLLGQEPESSNASGGSLWRFRV